MNGGYATIQCEASMILCPILQFHRYHQLHPLFTAVAAFLASGTLAALPEGRTDLSGDDLYVSNSLQARTRPAADALLEAHRTYIDIQVLLAGTETLGWSPLKACRMETVPYDPSKDVVFFRDVPKQLIRMEPGQLVVFFPEDAHAPLIGDGEIVRKLVVKVRV